jgi:hypothetical protein
MKVDESGAKFGWKGVIQPFKPHRKSLTEKREKIDIEEKEEVLPSAAPHESRMVEGEIKSEPQVVVEEAVLPTDAQSRGKQWREMPMRSGEIVNELFSRSIVDEEEEGEWNKPMEQTSTTELTPLAEHNVLHSDPVAMAAADFFVHQQSPSIKIEESELPTEEEEEIFPQKEHAVVVKHEFSGTPIGSAEQQVPETHTMYKEPNVLRQTAEHENLPEAVFAISDEPTAEAGHELSSIKETREGAFGHGLLISEAPVTNRAYEELSSDGDVERIEDGEEALISDLERDATVSSLETEASSVVTVIRKTDSDGGSEKTDEASRPGSELLFETEEVELVHSESVEGPEKSARFEKTGSPEYHEQETFFPSEHGRREDQLEEEEDEEAVFEPLQRQADPSAVKTRSLYGPTFYEASQQGYSHIFKAMSMDEPRSMEREEEPSIGSIKSGRSQSLSHRSPIIEVSPPEDGEKEQWQIAEEDYVPPLPKNIIEEEATSDIGDDFVIVESEEVALSSDYMAEIHEPPMKLSSEVYDEGEEEEAIDTDLANKEPNGKQTELGESRNVLEDVYIIPSQQEDSEEKIIVGMKSLESVERGLHAKTLVDEAMTAAVEAVQTEGQISPDVSEAGNPIFREHDTSSCN